MYAYDVGCFYMNILLYEYLEHIWNILWRSAKLKFM